MQPHQHTVQLPAVRQHRCANDVLVVRVDWADGNGVHRGRMHTVKEDGNAADEADKHGQPARLRLLDDDVCQALAAATALDEASNTAQEPVE